MITSDGRHWVLLVLAAAVASGRVASAQCPQWKSGFQPPGVEGTVTDMVVFDDGSGPALYVAGLFDHAGGVPAKNLARWDGTQWSARPEWTAGDIRDLVVYDDGHGP